MPLVFEKAFSIFLAAKHYLVRCRTEKCYGSTQDEQNFNYCSLMFAHNEYS